ncbi:hypothetical protein BDV06DRAFT_208756 [Aspergillus oleicola]
MPWPSPIYDVSMPPGSLIPEARATLYAIFMSTCGNIGTSSDDLELQNREVSCIPWLETELSKFDDQRVHLLAFYTMSYGGKILPKSLDAQVPATVTVSPGLARAFSECKSQDSVPIDVTSYYKCNDSTIIKVAKDCNVESAQFIQQSFMDLAIRINETDQGNLIVNRIRRDILNRLPESPKPILPDILNCLINSIQTGSCIADAECFVLERWVFETTVSRPITPKESAY